MNRRIANLLLGVVLLPVASGVHAAQCDDPKTSREVAQCLGNELRDSDAKINASYRELMEKLSDSDKATLRNEQRLWIRERDSACELDMKESNREKWYQLVLADYGKTVCVTRYTRKRTAQLEWVGGERGSNRGQDLKLGSNYNAVLSVSTDSFEPYLKRNAIIANFGDKAMAYALPAGYRPWRSQTLN